MGFHGDGLMATELIVKSIFNPAKKRSSRFAAFAKLPIIPLAENDSLVNLARKSGLILVLSVAKTTRFTVTPEAILALDVVGKDGDSGKLGFTEALVHLNEIYRELIFAKVVTGEKLKTLALKHIAIVLFLLMNGSVGEQKPCVADSQEKKFVIEEIVLSFIEGPEAQVKDIYAFSYYLVEAKEVLGDVIYNSASRYYVKSDSIDYVLDMMKRALAQVPNAKRRWEWMKASYDLNGSFLRAKGISFSRTSDLLRIERRLFGPKGDKPGGKK